LKAISLALLAVGLILIVASFYSTKIVGDTPIVSEERMEELDMAATDLHAASIERTEEAIKKGQVAREKLAELKAESEAAAAWSKKIGVLLRIAGLVLALGGGGLYFATANR
jgi:hypothetical protein